MNIPELWQQFGAAHPIYSHLTVLLVGTFLGPRLLSWGEEKGIPKLVDWADEHQEALLKRAGLTPDQIKAVREHEAADLRRAADEIDRKIKEETDQTSA